VEHATRNRTEGISIKKRMIRSPRRSSRFDESCDHFQSHRLVCDLLGEQAAFQLHARDVRCMEIALQEFLDDPWINGLAAGKDVDRRIAVFGPCMNRDV